MAKATKNAEMLLYNYYYAIYRQNLYLEHSLDRVTEVY